MPAADIHHPLKYARIEEERRFLLETIPTDLSAEEPFHRIIDHYVPGTRLRLRRIESPSGEESVLKLGQKYQTPDQKDHQTIMTNIYLNHAEYQALAVLGGSLLTKRRYRYHYAGNAYSLDVFEGNLDGLVLAEIEGRSGVDISSLPVPKFATREVTDDPMFSGSKLSELSQDDFHAWLATW
jgi:CYTH domain-containing protein